MTVNAHLGLECDECGAQVVPGLWKVGDDCRHCPGHIRVPPSSASVPPEPPTLNASDVAQIVRTLGLEYDDMRHGWWLPGEPSPVFCTSIPHAVAESQRLCDNDVAALRAELAEATVERRAADYLAGVCSLAVHRHKIDARSEIGDALLDYASTRYGDSNPIGGVDATYQKLHAARSAGRARSEEGDTNG